MEHHLVGSGRLGSKIRASRTIVPALQHAHDRLIDRFPLYNAWHLHPRAVITHWIATGISIAIIATALLYSVSIAQAANACVSAATGLWSSPATWSSCGGSFPIAGDTVTIASGHIVTVDVDSAASSVVIAANAAAGGNGITIDPGITLAISGAITLTIPTAATTDLAVGAGSLMAGSIAIPGSGTGGRFATVSVSTGTITTTGSITFSGSAPRARFTSTGASMVNVGGDFGSGGTLTTTATGTINFNGSVSQAIGAYTTYNNLDINSTGGSVIFLGTTTVGGALTVNTGTLNMAAISPTITGLTTVNSTLLISSTTGTKILGDLTIASGGTMSFTAAEAITMNGNVVVDGTGVVTGTTGVWTFRRVGGGTISGTAASPIALTSSTFTTPYTVSTALTSPTITVTGTTVTNSTTIVANTALSGTGTLFQASSATLNLGGTSGITTLTATASPNTVNYTSTTGAQTIKGTTYHHLNITKSGQIGTLGAATTINGDLSVTAGSLNDGGFQITGNATGTLTVASGATLRLGVAATATLFPTVFVPANISLPLGSTVVYNSNVAQTIDVSVPYANLSLVATAAVTKTIAGALTVNGALNVGANNTLADAGNLITAKGDVVMTGSHTGSSMVLLTGSSAGHALTGGGSYANLELDDTNGATQTAAVTVTGTLDITTGTWSSSNTLAVSGVTTVFGILNIASTTGTKTLDGTTVKSGGIFRFSVAETLAANGLLTIESGGTMDFVAAGIVNLAHDLMVDGTGVISGTTGLWTFSKVGGGAIGGTTASLTIAGNTTFATAYTVAYPFTVNGYTVNVGVNQINTSTVTINGTLAGAGTFTQDPSTVLNLRSATITSLTATAAGNIVHYIGGANGTVKGTTYLDLDIDKDIFTGSAAGTVIVTDDLTVTTGTLNLAGSTFTVGGNTDIYSTLTDTSGGGSGGTNVYQGLVTVHPGASWTGINGEAVDHHFQNGLAMHATTFVAGSGAYIFEMNNQSLTGSTIVDFRELNIDGVILTSSISFDARDEMNLLSNGSFVPDAGVVVNPTLVQGTLGGTGRVDVTRILATADFSSQYRFATNILTDLEIAYIGTAPQVVSAVSYTELKISNASGVTLPADVTVAGVLAFNSGNITTGAYRLILASSGSVTRTSGHVVGKFQKAIPTGSPTVSFEIGDGANYLPVDIEFALVSTAGDLLTATTTGDHVDIASSGITPTKSVNRFWTIEDIGMVFTNYSATFRFVASDIDATADSAGFVVAKKDAAWELLNTGTRTSTSAQATGVTSFSDFQIGTQGPDAAPIATSVTILGTAEVGNPIAGHYTYFDAESDTEGISTYRWLRNNVAISGATGLSYLLTEADLGKKLVFEVTPVAIAGTSPGSSAQSAEFGPIEASSVVVTTIQPKPTTSLPSPTVSTPVSSPQNPVAQEIAGIVPMIEQFMASAGQQPVSKLILLLILALVAYLLSKYPYWIIGFFRNRLYVGNLARDIDVMDLKKIFESAGHVRSTTVCDSNSKHSLRYGFVTMASSAGSKKALKELNDKIIHGHKLIVKTVPRYLVERLRHRLGLR